MTNAIALKGTGIIAREKELKLLTYFSKDMVDRAKGFGRISSDERAVELVKEDAKVIQSVNECGIYGALWRLSESLGTGFDIELREIALRQETIEICEYYKINPYRLLSSDCLLIATANGAAVTAKLKENGITAAIIGQANDSNDKRLLSGDEIRYLDRVRKDELYKVIDKKDILSELSESS